MKTSELTGAALDWAVSKAEGINMEPRFMKTAWVAYSTDWSQGGPIIEREKITLDYFGDGGHEHGGEWLGQTWDQNGNLVSEEMGYTPLIAAMRCYVASRLGDEVTIPEELK
jgi:hypothetical protein